jgi:DNA polymerase bacteriophage-type
MQKIYLDFETYYDVQLSLTKMSTVQYVNNPEFKVWGVGIKVEDGETEWYNEEETPDVLQQIDWANTAVVCHNTLFDAYILTQYFNCIPAFYYDTAAMSRGLYPNMSASLANACKREFPNDETMRKGEELVNAKGVRDLDPELDAQIGGYCIQDVDLTYALFQSYMANYPDKELQIIDLTVRLFVEPKLMLDRGSLTTYKDEIAIKTAAGIEASGTTREILASQQKFKAYLEDLGIVVPTKKSPTTGKKIPAFGKNDSAYIQMCNMYPEHKHIWDARELVKSRIEETRAQRFIDSCNPDGTFSIPLRYYAAHTGRFGGADKINLQNLPRGSKLRTALMAPQGQKLFIADLSNIEARMLAWLSKEADLLDAFATGRDVYCEFASQIYGRTITKQDKLERYVGKTAILGLGYGMGADKFQATLKTGSPSVELSDTAAKSIVMQYRGMYPNIPQLWSGMKDSLFQMINPQGYGLKYGPLTIRARALELPNGMALNYPNLMFEYGNFVYKTEREIIRTHGPRITENVVQALARIVITDQMLEVQAMPEVDIVLQVHDEIIAIGSELDSDATMEKIINIMRTAPDWCSDLPLDAEGGVSQVYDK